MVLVRRVADGSWDALLPRHTIGALAFPLSQAGYLHPAVREHSPGRRPARATHVMCDISAVFCHGGRAFPERTPFGRRPGA
eukprot:CAMPEP_0119142400 /NCGR_PEP_ID=MMETSP1310-20130426/32556_1 /TAXON_ID=464262 /ORGANISM="Genus nov. species nov., Strain RCC2339" /LENGTH=80 /DNA_ID=CAMNT_0007133933 /DNA_START=263 /DNA_END=505 /DNA_ORIENTATION=-